MKTKNFFPSQSVLFCFPFAGGNHYSYRDITPHLHSSLKVIPLELPGHGKRGDEALLTDIHAMVSDLEGQVESHLGHRGDVPYAIWGHSMGAVLAYLFSVRRYAEGKRLPGSLVLTGQGAPSVRAVRAPRHLLPRGEFFRMVEAFGGLPDEVMENELLQDYVEPLLRADIEALDSYVYRESEKIPVPVLVLAGEDEGIEPSALSAWGKETSEGAEIRMLPGKHFFIFDQPAVIAEAISSRVMRVSEGGRRDGTDAW